MTPTMAILLVALLAGAACSVAGVFLVLRRSAMLADAMSHSLLPGLVAGFVLANGPHLGAGFLGATAAAVVTVWLVELLTKSRLVKEDSAIGIVFPAMFAIGVVIIARYFSNAHLDTDAVLYGEIALAPFDKWIVGGTNLGPIAAWILAALLFINCVGVGTFAKELKLTTFDPGLASVLGISPTVVHYGLMTLVAVTTVAAFSAVGAILAVGLIIVPAATARLLTNRLWPTLLLSLGIGVVAGIIGSLSAMALDVSISGMIACTLGALFLLAFALSPSQGVLTQAMARRRLRHEFAARVLIMHLATHEGTPASDEESRLEHLSSEFGWPEHRVEQIVRLAESRRWVLQSGDRLRLSDEGRAEVVAFSASF